MKNLFILSILCALSVLSACKEDTVGYVLTGTITGRVVTDGDFTPIENAKVTLTPTNSTVFTDSDGYFLFESAEAGDYSVSSTKDGYLTSFKPATVTADLEVNVVFEMEIETAGNKPPLTPILLTPVENEQDVALSVNFIWSCYDPENDTIRYKLRVKNARNNDVFEVNNLLDTTYALTNLYKNTKYFWQVSASDNINDEVWSTTFSFKTTLVNEYSYLIVKKVNENSVIFAVNAEGDEMQLTDENENCWRPRTHSSTNKIAFIKLDNFEPHLFVMNDDGSDSYKVTSLPIKGFKDSEMDFSWSPDGSKLLYPNFDKLYSINKDGGNLELIHETWDGNFISECDWSQDGKIIAVKTNNASGYNASIYTIDTNGNGLENIIKDQKGAIGGINISVDNKMLLFTRDVSEFENTQYRQLDSRLFIYHFDTKAMDDISSEKSNGTLDLDPRFSPNEAEVIFVNTSNVGNGSKTIYTQRVDPSNEIADDVFVRQAIIENAFMPDWE